MIFARGITPGLTSERPLNFQEPICLDHSRTDQRCRELATNLTGWIDDGVQIDVGAPLDDCQDRIFQAADSGLRCALQVAGI